ncbi:protein of unknown function (plasmid) [Agrobacterium pusense]|uniref:Uncharacterized protein n=1 Tax=Agrobacterium pusense TaxID=648995 RepID=U4Q4I8_9HYPH|nr:protein of unknown function [Agrobacterium pusense]
MPLPLASVNHNTRFGRPPPGAPLAPRVADRDRPYSSPTVKRKRLAWVIIISSIGYPRAFFRGEICSTSP